MNGTFGCNDLAALATPEARQEAMEGSVEIGPLRACWQQMSRSSTSRSIGRNGILDASPISDKPHALLDRIARE
jgi:hypothetical protein